MSALEDHVVYEIEALKSIYLDDFEDRGEVWGSPCFAIKVKPQAEGDMTCCVTVVITLSKSYPKVVPRCELDDVKGLSKDEEKKLKSLMTKTAEEHVGEVMIHEIVDSVQNYLYDHNRTPSIPLYKQMQDREKMEETALDVLRRGEVLGEGDPDSETGQKKLQQSGSANKSRSLGDRGHESIDGPNLRAKYHSGERSTSLTDDIAGDKASVSINRKVWDVENKNEYEEGSSEGGETWLTDLLKHKISENLMEYDDDLDDDDEHENNLLQQQTLLMQQKQGGVEGGSRYHKEFQEIHLLGKGGGGEVWKVKNNLDRRAYAVKKILLNPTDRASNNRIRREVTTISGLLHKHVVRYYAAWVEKLTIPEAAFDDADTSSVSERSKTAGIDFTAAKDSGLDIENGDEEPSVGCKVGATTSTTIMNFRMRNFEDNFDLEFEFPPATMSSSDGDSGAEYYDTSDEDENSSDSESSNDDGIFSATNQSDGSEYGNLVTFLSDNEEAGVDLEDRSATHKGEHNTLEEITQETGADNQDDATHDEEFGATGPKVIRYLYIQMEFCDATLYDAIHGGKLWQAPTEVMRLFRQLLEAICYIHSQGVIHRDLKPANIFLDAEGNVKIGDFGLATTDRQSSQSNLKLMIEDHSETAKDITSDTVGALKKDVSMTSNQSLKDTFLLMSLGENSFGSIPDEWSKNLTGGVGTALYRAPEQEGRIVTQYVETSTVNDSSPSSQRNTKVQQYNSSTRMMYDAKADMYSLGIILFEMCHQPFSTGMERVETLRLLRGEDSVIPPYFIQRVPENLVSIIEWLVNNDPSKRPSAMELQNSPLMPARIELDKLYLEEVLSVLRHNSNNVQSVITTLFNRKNVPLVEKSDHDNDDESADAVSSFSDSHMNFSKNYFDIYSRSLHLVNPLSENMSISQSPIADVSNFKRYCPLHLHDSIASVVEKIFLHRGATRYLSSVLIPKEFAATKWFDKKYLQSWLIHTKSSSWATQERVANFTSSKNEAKAQSSQSKQDVSLPSKSAALPNVGTSTLKQYTLRNWSNIASRPVELMDRKGIVVCLPFDMLTGYARFVSRSGITNATRFSVDRVYREKIPRKVVTGALRTMSSETESLNDYSPSGHVRSSNYSKKLNGKDGDDALDIASVIQKQMALKWGGTHPMVCTEAVYDIIRENTFTEGYKHEDVETEKSDKMRRTAGSSVLSSQKLNVDYSNNSSSAIQSAFRPPSSAAQTSPLGVSNDSLERNAFIEADVLLAAVEVMNGIDPTGAIGTKIVRIGESRLGKSILDLCGAPHPRQSTLQALSLISDSMIDARISFSLESTIPQPLSHVPRGGAKMVFQSSKTANEMLSRANILIKSTGLPPEVQKALQPFIKIITNPIYYDPPSSKQNESLCGALNMLQQIEKAFYEHEIITTMRYKVSKAVKDKEISRSSSVSASAATASDPGYTRKELRRYRLLLQEFDEAVVRLKTTLSIFSRTLGFQISRNKEGKNESTENISHRQGIAFSHGNKAHNTMLTSPATSAESCHSHTFLDLGIEVYQDLSLYKSGLFFQLEAVIVSSPSDGVKAGKIQSSHHSSPHRRSALDVHHHLLGQGGHFEHLLKLFRHPQYHANPAMKANGNSASVGNLPSFGNATKSHHTPKLNNAVASNRCLIAMGMRLSISRLQEFVVSSTTVKNPLNVYRYLSTGEKLEGRVMHSVAPPSSASASSTQLSNIVIPCNSLLTKSPIPMVLVVDIDSFESSDEPSSNHGNFYNGVVNVCRSFADVALVLQTLRQGGEITAAESLHELHAGVGDSFSQLLGGFIDRKSKSDLSLTLHDMCRIYRIPFLVALVPDPPSSSRSVNKEILPLCKVKLVRLGSDVSSVDGGNSPWISPHRSVARVSSNKIYHCNLEQGADVWVPLSQLNRYFYLLINNDVEDVSYDYEPSRGYMYNKCVVGNENGGIIEGGVSVLTGDLKSSHEAAPHSQHSSGPNASSNASMGVGNCNNTTDSSNTNSSSPQSWRKAFVVVERSGPSKDKKQREKEHSRWKQRVDKYLIEVMGVQQAALSAEKHIPVVCVCEIQFRLLCELAGIISDLKSESKRSKKSSGQPRQNKDSVKREKSAEKADNDLMKFIEEQSQVSTRRGLRALVIELSETLSVGSTSMNSNSGMADSSGSTSNCSNVLQYVLLYCTAEDRFQLTSYIPSVLNDHIV